MTDKHEILTGLKSKEIVHISLVPAGLMDDGCVTIIGNIPTLKILGYETPPEMFNKTQGEKDKEREEVRKKSELIEKVKQPKERV